MYKNFETRTELALYLLGINGRNAYRGDTTAYFQLMMQLNKDMEG